MCTEWYRRVQQLVGNDRSLFPGHAELNKFRLVRLPTVLAGGHGGKSIWNGQTYANRVPLTHDSEYSLEERRVGFLHYVEMGLKSSGVASRLDVGKNGGSETGPEGKILLFNREKGRRIRNAQDIQKKLVAAFGQERVFEKIWTPEMVPIPRAMDFMRGVSIMVTPHGANIGNTVYMLPGR